MDEYDPSKTNHFIFSDNHLEPIKSSIEQVCKAMNKQGLSFKKRVMSQDAIAKAEFLRYHTRNFTDNQGQAQVLIQQHVMDSRDHLIRAIRAEFPRDQFAYEAGQNDDIVNAVVSCIQKFTEDTVEIDLAYPE